MRVRLRNPERVIEVAGVRDVRALLAHLGIIPETVLVIRGGELLTPEEALDEADEVEIRPVVSGGRR